MQRLLLNTAGACEGAGRGEVYAEGEGGRPQDAEVAREVGGDRLGDHCAGADGKVRSVLIADPDGDQQAAVAAEMRLDVAPRQVREQEGAG